MTEFRINENVIVDCPTQSQQRDCNLAARRFWGKSRAELVALVAETSSKDKPMEIMEDVYCLNDRCPRRFAVCAKGGVITECKNLGKV